MLLRSRLRKKLLLAAAAASELDTGFDIEVMTVISVLVLMVC